MNNKFGTILYTIFLTIFLIVGTKGYAQRDIQVFEPDFNKDYALHVSLYKDLRAYPNAYIEFYSDYARKHKIKKTVSFLGKRWKNTIYYNKNGYITRTESKYDKDSTIYTYEYSNRYQTITRCLNSDSRISKTYYFNEKHVLDSTTGTSWRTKVLKPFKDTSSFLSVIKHDTVKFIYGENGLLTTVNSSLDSNVSVEFRNPRTFEVGAQSNAPARTPWRDFEPTHDSIDSMAKFAPINLFKQKEGNLNDPYRRTTWSMLYEKVDYGKKKYNTFEITQRSGYMFIHTSNPRYPANISSSFYYEWNDRGQMTTYSECTEEYVMGLLWSKSGKFYTKVRGGWQMRSFTGSVANNLAYKVKVSKKGIFDKWWSIEYFK